MDGKEQIANPRYREFSRKPNVPDVADLQSVIINATPRGNDDKQKPTNL